MDARLAFQVPLMAVTLLAALSCGCRNNPHTQLYIDNVNAEKRLLEDQLYELQFDYEAKIDELEQLREDNARLRQGDGVLPSDPRRPSSSVLGSGTPGAAPNGSSAIGSGVTGNGSESPIPIPDLGPPKIEPGDTVDPPAGNSEESGDGGATGDGLENLAPPKLDFGTEAGEPTAARNEPVGDVQSLGLATDIGAGSARSKEQGEPGLTIRVVPRDRASNFVRRAGRVSVVALDPVQRTRLARWEFSVADVKKGLTSDPEQAGVLLHLPWEGDPPTADRLHLFVRYWTTDSHWLEVDREIDTVRHSFQTARWTPRAPSSPVVPGPAGGDADRSEVAARPATHGGEAGTPRRNTPNRRSSRPRWRPIR